MDKFKSPIEAEELADHAAEALNEISNFGGDPRKVLAFFLENLEFRLKTYLNELFDFDFDWQGMDLWQILPEAEELAVIRFSEEDPKEKQFWISHIQEISDYFITLHQIASPEHLSELPDDTVRDYALLILGSMTIASKLAEKPRDHSVDGPSRKEFRILYGPYPQIEDMPPGSLAGEMAAIIDSCRKVWGVDTSIPSATKPEGLYLYAEIISRDPLYHAHQYSDRPHIVSKSAEGITAGDSPDIRFTASQAADFVWHLRQARNFVKAKARFGDIPDSFILAVAAIKSAYHALLEIQHQEYRPWKKTEWAFIEKCASDARRFKMRLDYLIAEQNAGKSLGDRRKSPFYKRLLGELERQLHISRVREHPDRVPYRHTVEQEIVSEFKSKGLPIIKKDTRTRWLYNNAPEYSWAIWRHNHGTHPKEKFIPRHIVDKHIENYNQK